jgi:hypothetical protein
MRVFSQESIDSIRRFALDLQWSGSLMIHRFSQGNPDVISQLQHSCENPLVCNHVIEIDFQEKEDITIYGMLYSKYGWKLVLSNNVLFDFGVLRLENNISDIPAPNELRDWTLSHDSICIINPDFEGHIPTLPRDWRNT